MKKRLGQLLINDGKLTVDELNEALELQKSKGGMIGNILLDMGCINDEDLSKYLQTQKKLRDAGR